MLIFILFLLPLLSIFNIIILNRNYKNLFSLSLIWCCCIFFYSFFLLNLSFFDDLIQISSNLLWGLKEENIFYWGPINFSIDFISFIFILLSNLLIIICIIISWNTINILKKEFILCLMITNFLLIGVFSSMDILIFYIFFEAILIPIFLIISIWGARDQRFKASYYFFFYTLFGSLFMFITIFKIFFDIGSTSFLILCSNSTEYQYWFIIAFFLSLAIKVPMFPVHIWLPQAHVEAPVSGSVLLAGILLKLGGYGFLRFSLPLLPEGAMFLSPLILALSIVSIIYASILTVKQTDIKRLIAYSSVSHMGFVTLGLFSYSIEGILAALILMIAHGFVSSGLFIAATVIYDRVHSRIIRNLKGLLLAMPLLATLFLILTLANISIPGSLNFWGELLAFKSSFISIIGIYLTILILLSIVIGAIYSINLFNTVFFGVFIKSINYIRDVNKKEFFVLFILSTLTWSIGIATFKISYLYTLNIYNLVCFFS